jgi:hypothetical protein
VTKRRLAAVPDPPPHPHDVCGDCGHLYSHHRDGNCVAYRPAGAQKSVDYRADPITVATQIAVQSTAKAASEGLHLERLRLPRIRPVRIQRFVPELDAELRELVKMGKRRRTVLPIAELA